MRHKKVMLRCIFFCASIVQELIFLCYATMETDVSVDCHSDPQHILVSVQTDIPFDGLVYVSGHYGNRNCTTRGTKNSTTILLIPYHGCNTVQKSPGLFVNRVTVQQHRTIVSAGDGEYDVGCKMFTGNLQVDSSNHVGAISVRNEVQSVQPSSASEPEVQLRIYDFENDIFVDTVRLGQVVELEITIRDGRQYQGSVSDCDALNSNGTRFPVVRNFCPVDLSVSDKVYVDDQSRTTGDFYLYIPFRVFRFLDGSKVSFTCNVIVCHHDCPWKNCGDYLGMSYGRKKRSTSDGTQDNSHVKMTVTKQVTVMDGNHRTPRTSGFGIIEEEVIHPKIATPSNTNAEPPKSVLPKEYLIGGSALVISLFVSVCINIYLLVMTRRRFNNHGSDGSSSDSSVHEAPVFGNRYHPMMRNDLYYNRYSSPKVEWKYESREILYPPMPIRHASAAQRAHSFRY